MIDFKNFQAKNPAKCDKSMTFDNATMALGVMS